MNFESLALAGLSLGLSYNDILEINIGLLIGLLNEKNNQFIEYKLKQNNLKDENDETIIIGDGNMLKNI